MYNFWKTREKRHRSREYTWLGTKNVVTVLKQPARVCSDGIESVCSGTTWACLQWCYWVCMQRGYSSVVELSTAVREVPGSNPGVPLYNFWKTREKWHRSRENTWLGTKNIVTVLKQPARVCSDGIESVCSGDIAQWKSIQLQSERSLVRTRVSPCIICERLEKKTSIAREPLTRNKKHCNSAQTTCTCLQWWYWIFMQRGYSSVVEHSAAVREVPGSNPGVPLYNFWKTRKKLTLIARVHLTRNKKHCNSAQTTWACLQ